MIKKIMVSDSCGQVYYLADYPQGSVQEWANHIHKAYGYSGSVLKIPQFLLKMIARFGDIVKGFGIPFPLFSSRLKMLFNSMKELNLIQINHLYFAECD